MASGIDDLGLAQATRRYIGRAADGLAGYEQLNSPILLPAGRAVVRRCWKGVAKALRRDGRCAHALLHKISAYRVRAILRQPLVHGIGTDVICIAADLNIQN